MFVADSVDGRTDFVCDVSKHKTLGDILKSITKNDEKVLSRMIDETGCFRPNVAVFFGSDQQLRLKRPDIIVANDVEEISIFPALSGG